MSGHGHVTPNPDGSRARCGGPGLCNVCSRELAQKNRMEMPDPVYHPIQLDSEEFKEVRQIGVARPGDTLVITFGRRLHMQEAHEFNTRLKEMFPELRFMILDGAIEVTIVRSTPEQDLAAHKEQHRALSHITGSTA